MPSLRARPFECPAHREVRAIRPVARGRGECVFDGIVPRDRLD